MSEQAASTPTCRQGSGTGWGLEGPDALARPPLGSTRSPGCPETLTHCLQGQCPKAPSLRALPEACHLAGKSSILIAQTFLRKVSCIPEIKCGALATQSVAHGLAASPSPAVLLKHRLPDPSPEPTLRERYHQARPVGTWGPPLMPTRLLSFS